MQFININIYMILTIICVIYVVIGIFITNTTMNADEEYRNHLETNFYLYIKEIISWFPDMICFYLNNENNNDNDNEKH